MGRIERLGRVLPGDGPVVPVAGVRPKRRDERQDEEEADREQARREHARNPGVTGRAPGSGDLARVDVRA